MSSQQDPAACRLLAKLVQCWNKSDFWYRV